MNWTKHTALLLAIIGSIGLMACESITYEQETKVFRPGPTHGEGIAVVSPETGNDASDEESEVADEAEDGTIYTPPVDLLPEDHDFSNPRLADAEEEPTYIIDYTQRADFVVPMDPVYTATVDTSHVDAVLLLCGEGQIHNDRGECVCDAHQGYRAMNSELDPLRCERDVVMMTLRFLTGYNTREDDGPGTDAPLEISMCANENALLREDSDQCVIEIIETDEGESFEAGEYDLRSIDVRGHSVEHLNYIRIRNLGSGDKAGLFLAAFGADVQLSNGQWLTHYDNAATNYWIGAGDSLYINPNEAE